MLRNLALILLTGTVLWMPFTVCADNRYPSVRGDGETRLSIDETSIHHQGNLVRFWVKKSASDNLPDSSALSWSLGNQHPSSPLISKEHRLANCEKRTMASDHFVFYSPTGEITGTMTYPMPAFHPILAGTPNEFLFRQACSKSLSLQAPSVKVKRKGP